MRLSEPKGMSILDLRRKADSRLQELRGNKDLRELGFGSPEWRDKREKFVRFHNKNPHVYHLFNKYAVEAFLAGNKKFSHWLIMNRIRWDSLVKTDGAKYKIPNEHIAFYARLWMKRTPYDVGHDFFTLKRMKGEPGE